MEFDRAALLRSFRDEAEELLSQLERLALDLDENPGERGPIEDMFRCAHTLKGGASCVGFEQVMSVAHELEALFEAVTAQGRAPDRGLIALTLEAVDVLRRGAQVPDSECELPLAEAEPLLQRIARWLESHDEAPREAVVWSAEREAATQGHSLRVDVERLDLLLNLVGEVAIAQGRLSNAIEGSGDAASQSALQAFQGLFHGLHESVMRLRLVPLRPTLERFRRAVRELSQRVGKRVELVIDGDVEVDMTLADALRDPLMHMLRNAIDHGIEAPGRRVELGKPAMGRITISARYDGNYVVVTLRDDGAGLDTGRLLEKAKQLGLPIAGADDAALQELLYAPGLSTAEQVTNISGRGIGMDVVRRGIEALRG
ncbi:MAG TPA: Hpt domain-containing protein, partial [Polyangiaceae bacterium]|nr:Hpt domain-containing protein [Polyangiaceae bacterium]